MLNFYVKNIAKKDEEFEMFEIISAATSGHLLTWKLSAMALLTAQFAKWIVSRLAHAPPRNERAKPD